MAPSRVVILGVAAVAAAGAGYVAKNMTAAPPAQIVVEERQAEPAIRTREILALTRDLPMGAAINGEIGWQAWPSDAVTEQFITRENEPDALEKLQGSVARDSMYRGEPLRRSKLIGEGQSFMSSILPAGKRAVATQIAADTSAGGFILPNDYVDVIMTRRNQDSNAGGGPSYVTETILKNIRVLAIDQAIQEDEEGRRVKVGETATLELSPQQAEIITVAQQMADRLTLSLRAVTDTLEQSTDEADYLVSGAGRKGTIRMIKSGEVTEVGARK